MFKRLRLICLVANCVSFVSYSQEVKVIDLNTLQSEFMNHSDTTYVVNFFASWCSPCLKELPDFVSFSQNIGTKKIKVLFVSLDSKEDYSTSLTPLIEKFGLPKTVFLLNESLSGPWIDQVDSAWSGSIPATWIYKNGGKEKQLYSEQMSEARLNKLLK